MEKYTRITTFEKVINISERFCAAKIVLTCQNGLWFSLRLIRQPISDKDNKYDEKKNSQEEQRSNKKIQI